MRSLAGSFKVEHCWCGPPHRWRGPLGSRACLWAHGALHPEPTSPLVGASGSRAGLTDGGGLCARGPASGLAGRFILGRLRRWRGLPGSRAGLTNGGASGLADRPLGPRPGLPYPTGETGRLDLPLSGVTLRILWIQAGFEKLDCVTKCRAKCESLSFRSIHFANSHFLLPHFANSLFV